MKSLFNIKPFKKLVPILFDIGCVDWIPKIIKYLPKNWTDINGSNLYHLSARYHNKNLFQLARYNEADINQLDNDGNAPLHRFIEACFIMKNMGSRSIVNKTYVREVQNKIIFEYNEALLLDFLENGASVKTLKKEQGREGQWGEDVVTFSRNNIVGTSLELLVILFWQYMLSNPNFNNRQMIEEYKKFFKTLTQYGAEVNLLVDTGEFFNLENETLQDAMQFTNKIIVSHFFVKYIVNNNDVEAIIPFLLDIHTDFSLRDEGGNTVLHHLFGRISTRYNFLEKEKIDNLLLELSKNPSFKKEHLYIYNNFRATPLACFKRESAVYGNTLQKLVLKNELDNNLNNKNSETEKKRNKI